MHKSNEDVGRRGRGAARNRLILSSDAPEAPVATNLVFAETDPMDRFFGRQRWVYGRGRPLAQEPAKPATRAASALDQHCDCASMEVTAYRRPVMLAFEKPLN